MVKDYDHIMIVDNDELDWSNYVSQILAERREIKASKHSSKRSSKKERGIYGKRGTTGKIGDKRRLGEATSSLDTSGRMQENNRVYRDLARGLEGGTRSVERRRVLETFREKSTTHSKDDKGQTTDIGGIGETEVNGETRRLEVEVKAGRTGPGDEDGEARITRVNPYSGLMDLLYSPRNGEGQREGRRRAKCRDQKRNLRSSSTNTSTEDGEDEEDGCGDIDTANLTTIEHALMYGSGNGSGNRKQLEELRRELDRRGLHTADAGEYTSEDTSEYTDESSSSWVCTLARTPCDNDC